MSVINATQYKKTSMGKGPISKLFDWIESMFGHSEPIASTTTPATHGEPSRGNGGELEMSATFGWDHKSGWSPHGDEGMR